MDILKDIGNVDQTPELDIELQKREKQKQKLSAFIGEKGKVFASNLLELGSTDVYKHRIETG